MTFYVFGFNNLHTLTNASASKVALVSILITFAAIITPSPLFAALTSITGNIYYVILVFIVAALIYKSILKQNTAILVSLIVMSFQLCAVIYWGEIKLIILPFYFLSALFLAYAMGPREVGKYVEYSTKLILLLLAGGIIGFIYTYFFAGEPLLHFANEDTRQNGLYLTTLSNWYVRGVIRPAGIYDEPGALSFVVCLIAATRHFLGKSKKVTWILLLLGFITLSIAHIIYVALHLVEEIRTKSFKPTLAQWLILIIIFSLILISPVGDVISEFVIARFNIVDGGFVGDNRTILLINAYHYLSWPVFFFGLDANCIVKPALCIAKQYQGFGDNPLAPLVLGGLQFLPFYAVLIILLVISIKTRSLIIFGVLLLLLQRNEVMSYGYALLIAIFLMVVLRRKFFSRRTREKQQRYTLNSTLFIQP